MKQVIIEDNKHLARFFKEQEKYEDYIREQINEHIWEMIELRPHKIKTVPGCRYQDKTIFEYKIPLAKGLGCRVAYIQKEETAIVFFISTTLIKAQFTALVQALPEVTKH